MRKLIIRDIPERLPPSTLFLDDLQSIEDLVRSSIDSNFALSAFFYEVDGEFRVDSLEELKTNGGHSKTLTVGIECRRVLPAEVASLEEFSLVKMSVFSGANVFCPQCLRVNEREFCHEVRKIFDPRKHPFLAAIELLPENLRRFLISSIGSLAAVGFIWVCFSSGKYIYSLRLNGMAYALGFVITLGLSLLPLIPALAVIPFLLPSSGFCKVNFYYMREKALERQKSRKETFQKIILMILSAVVGAIGTLFVQWLNSGTKR